MSNRSIQTADKCPAPVAWAQESICTFDYKTSTMFCLTDCTSHHIYFLDIGNIILPVCIMQYIQLYVCWISLLLHSTAATLIRRCFGGHRCLHPPWASLSWNVGQTYMKLLYEVWTLLMFVGMLIQWWNLEHKFNYHYSFVLYRSGFIELISILVLCQSCGCVCCWFKEYYKLIS